MNDGVPPGQGEGDSQAVAVAVAGLLGQVGCVTVLIIAVALVAGLWLDAQFDTRPLLTIIFLLGSVPVTLYLMVRITLSGMNRVQSAAPTKSEHDTEEGDVGRPT